MRAIGSVYRLRRNGYSGPFFTGLMQFLCGVQLLLPTDTFSSSASYEVMQDWATAQGWGVFLLGCSAFIIVSAVKRRPEFVSVGALVAAFGWLVITVSVGLGNPAGILFPLVAVLTFRSLSLFREFADRKDDPHLTGPWGNADEFPPRPS